MEQRKSTLNRGQWLPKLWLVTIKTICIIHMYVCTYYIFSKLFCVLALLTTGTLNIFNLNKPVQAFLSNIWFMIVSIAHQNIASSIWLYRISITITQASVNSKRVIVLHTDHLQTITNSQNWWALYISRGSPALLKLPW